jgi:DedD protein
MDRELQERVVGAIVLVVVAVLVVPIFLDGSTSDEVEIVSESVTLPGQSTGQTETQKIVLNRDRSEPVPTAAPVQSPVAAPVAETPAPAPDTKTRNTAAEAGPEQPEKTASAAAPDASVDSPTGMWAVQLGSFSSQENAERLAASLRDKGYAAFLSQLKTGDGSLHRVRVGPQKDRAAAESVAAQLGKSGHAGQVVPHP